jgi:hypothetical protein
MQDRPTTPHPPPDDSHAFVREGQPSHLPAADRCVVCGASEAAHGAVSPLAELEARFGAAGWEIQANPGGVTIWIAVKKNGSQTRVIAAHGPGELYAKLESAEQRDRDEGRPLT